VALSRQPHRTLSRITRERTARIHLAFFGVPCEIEPEARHVEPMDVTFGRAFFMRQCEALLRVLPEFFRDFHGRVPLDRQERLIEAYA
jgi:hypothetical protein